MLWRSRLFAFMAENEKMSNLTWHNETRRLGDLVSYADNPRDIGEQQAKRLAHSRRKFRQPQTIAIGPGGEVYDGHQQW